MSDTIMLLSYLKWFDINFNKEKQKPFEFYIHNSNQTNIQIAEKTLSTIILGLNYLSKNINQNYIEAKGKLFNPTLDMSILLPIQKCYSMDCIDKIKLFVQNLLLNNSKYNTEKIKETCDELLIAIGTNNQKTVSYLLLFIYINFLLNENQNNYQFLSLYN